jgi:glutamate synthase domain-containing protein 2
MDMIARCRTSLPGARFAKAALHHDTKAMADLDTYVRRYIVENRARRVRLREAMDTRAAIVQETDRNSLLQRELE